MVLGLEGAESGCIGDPNVDLDLDGDTHMTWYTNLAPNQLADPAGPSLAVQLQPPVGAVLLNGLTVSTSAYSAGNDVAGLIDLGAVMPSNGGPRVLQGITVIEVGTQKAPLDFVIFGQKPAATFTDKSAFPTLTLADAQLIQARVSVANASYVTVGGVSTVVGSGGSQILNAAAGSQHLWLAINTSGTPTFGAATALTVIVNIG